MIGKSRREFLIISMSFLLVTFALLFSIFYLTTSSNRNEMILRELSFTEETYLDSNQIINQNSFVVEIMGNNFNDYLKVFDSNRFSEITINNVIEIATNRNYGYGSVDNIYYKISNGEKRLIVAIDSTDLNLLFKANLSTALIILASAYGAVFIIILLTSSKFVKPINDTLNRQLQFISNASHELKTPIAVISANAQVLKNIDDNKWVENIQTQTERMRVLVSDMLTLAKIDENTTKLVKEKFNLSEMVVACTLPFDALAFENGCYITLNVDNGVEYDGDVESIKIILNVLLDNAVKYSPRGSEIIVSLKKEIHPIITVVNSGSLIPDIDSNKIFERFYRGDNSRSRETGGSGLGLSIAKSVAEVNKWKISAKSIYGKTMTISLHM